MGRSTKLGRHSLFATMICVLVSAAELSGQEAEVRAAVDQIFAGMRTSKSQLVLDVFAPEARFAVISARNGPASIRSQAVDGWLGAIGESEGKWDEQVYDVEAQVDGNMASAWVPYTFYLDGEISHRGINSIELLRDADGWRVTQLSDTRKQDMCPDPLG